MDISLIRYTFQQSVQCTQNISVTSRQTFFIAAISAHRWNHVAETWTDPSETPSSCCHWNQHNN